MSMFLLQRFCSFLMFVFCCCTAPPVSPGDSVLEFVYSRKYMKTPSRIIIVVFTSLSGSKRKLNRPSFWNITDKGKLVAGCCWITVSVGSFSAAVARELRASHCFSEQEIRTISPSIGSVCSPVNPCFHHHHPCLHTRCHWHQLTPLWCNRSTGIWNTKRSMLFAGLR